MTPRVLIDTDVVLDVATDRKPFVTESKSVLVHVESGRALGYLSAHSVTTLFYILRKLGGAERTLSFLRGLLSYISVATEGHNDIVRALDSDLSDFEDAVQYRCALSNACGVIVTRNTDDYPTGGLSVLTPREFIVTYGMR